MPQFHVPQHLSGEMKMLRTLSAFAFLALMMPTMGRADDADVKKEITRLSQQVIDASIKGDTAALDALMADDYTVINPSGEVEDKAGHLKALKDGSLVFNSIQPSEINVRVYGDAAVLTARGQVKVKFKGQDVGGPVRTTEFYVKQGGKWRCVSAQVTRIAEPAGENR
jgi:ketosteroid isomerase-like protein